MNGVPSATGQDPSSSAASHVHNYMRFFQIKNYVHINSYVVALVFICLVYFLRYQYFLDRVTPNYYGRWITTAVLFVAFLARFLIAHKWYIVAYALAIYLLNIFLAFLTPRFDPALEALEQEEMDQESGFSLPTRSDDEFRPFIRRLPEFKFWLLSTRALLIALFCTLFEATDVPVFWPILLFYFLFLFFLTMRRQIQHMIQHKYLPFNLGKKQYKRSG